MRRSADLTSLVAGVCVVALGVLLLLDATGTFDLRFGVLAPAACAACGAILLASGMTPPAMIPRDDLAPDVALGGATPAGVLRRDRDAGWLGGVAAGIAQAARQWTSRSCGSRSSWPRRPAGSASPRTGSAGS